MVVKRPGEGVFHDHSLPLGEGLVHGAPARYAPRSARSLRSLRAAFSPGAPHATRPVLPGRSARYAPRCLRTDRALVGIGPLGIGIEEAALPSASRRRRISVTSPPRRLRGSLLNDFCSFTRPI